jgi:Ca2+-binding RTX toxin-like protein
MRMLIAVLAAVAATATVGSPSVAGGAGACFGSAATPDHRTADEQGVGIVGTDGVDVIIYRGTRPSSVLAMAGRDMICTGAARDFINAGYNGSSDAGSGVDKVSSGGGADTIYGQDKNDVLIGGGGSDSVFGHTGDDVLRGGPGNDVLRGGPGKDTCVGAGGNDRFVGCETKRQ